MANKRTRKRKKVKVRRLYKMQPFENAFVSYGANDRPFAVVKEASIMKIDVKAFLEGLEALNKVGNVLKQGQLSDEAQREVVGQIGGALEVLAKAGALEALDNKPVDKAQLEQKLQVIYGKMDSLTLSLQPIDLNLADYTSALKEEMQEVVESIETAPPPAAPATEEAASAAPAAAHVEEPPAETPPPTAEAAPADEPPAEEQATEDTPAQEAASEEEPAEEPAAEQEPDADEAADDEELVTKASLVAFGKELVTGIMSQVNEAVQTSVQKTVAQLPATRPADDLQNHTPREGSAFNSDIGMEQLDFGSTVDLSKMKLPGM